MSNISGKSDLVDIAGEVHAETEKAFRFFDGAKRVLTESTR